MTDVDSTLIRNEVIELLAEVAGTREQVAEVTERAMRGEIDFLQSLHERVATLAGLPCAVFRDTLREVTISPGAEHLIDEVHDRGGRVGAVSGGFLQILDPLATRLGLDYWEANVLEVIDDRLTGRVLGDVVDGSRKQALLQLWAAQEGVPRERIVAIGDGANDLLMMGSAGISVGYHPKPIVAQAADYVISDGGLDAAIEFLPA